MPEQEQEQEEQPQEEVQQSDTTQDTQQEETPAPLPQQTPNLDEVHNLYRGVLQEQSQRAQRLEQELAQLRDSRQEREQQYNTEHDVEMLTTNPRELIRQEIQAAIKPLNQQAGQWNRANQIVEYKNRLRNDPRFPFFQQEKFEPYFDNLLNQTQDINDNSVYAAYLASVGMFVQSSDFNSMSQAPQTSEVPRIQPNTHSQTVPTPPNPRPAPPQRQPTNSNRGSKKQYTENEKQLMRMRGMSEEQWEAELNALPSQVVSMEG